MDSYNHTGYAQVLEEAIVDNLTPSTNTITYTIGDDVITQSRQVNSYTAEHLLYDGQGSVRHHSDASGNLVAYSGCDTFAYDAYGERVDPLKGIVNEGLFYTGEQWDSSVEQYYLRARYYNPLNGRFNRMDPFAGNNQDPQSLHKYLYCHANPINTIDPTGMTLAQVVVGIGIGLTIAGIGLAIAGIVMENSILRDIGFWSLGIGLMLIAGGLWLGVGGMSIFGAEAIATTLAGSPYSFIVTLIGALTANMLIQWRTREDLTKFIESRYQAYSEGDLLIPPKGNLILRDSKYVRAGENFGIVQYEQPPLLPGDKIISYDSTEPGLRDDDKIRLVVKEVEKNGSLDKKYETIYKLESQRKNVIDDDLPEGWFRARRD